MIKDNNMKIDVKKAFDIIKNSWINYSYSGQKSRSKIIHDSSIGYTKNEYIEWLKKQDHLDKLLITWINSGKKISLTPSVDRLENNRTYELDNIRLVTWDVNRLSEVGGKVHVKKYEMLKHTPVVKIDINTGDIIDRYNTLKDASTANNILIGGISRSIKIKGNKAGGYLWMTEKSYDKDKALGLLKHDGNESQNRPVLQYDKTGLFFKRYSSIAKTRNDGFTSYAVSRACSEMDNGRILMHRDYLWFYEDTFTEDKLNIAIKHFKSKSVEAYDLSCNFIGRYETLTEAGRVTNTIVSDIGSCINDKRLTSNNMFWVRTEDPNKMERLARLAKENIGKNDRKYDKVDLYDLNEKLCFTGTPPEIARKYDLPIQGIKDTLTNKNHTVKGYTAFKHGTLGTDKIFIKRFKRIRKTLGIYYVFRFDLSGNLIKVFNSIKEAARSVECNVGLLQRVLVGARNNAMDSIWIKSFTSHITNDIKVMVKKRLKALTESNVRNSGRVITYDIYGNKKNEYINTVECAKDLNVVKSNINKCLTFVIKTCKGKIALYRFRSDHKEELFNRVKELTKLENVVYVDKDKVIIYENINNALGIRKLGTDIYDSILMSCMYEKDKWFFKKDYENNFKEK